MNQPGETYSERRRLLVAKIAGQRAEFSAAYARLEQPVRYTEYSLRGFGFLRSNPWIFAAVPAAVSILKTLWSSAPKKKKSASEPPQRQAQGTAPQLTGFKKTAATWGAHAWRLIQLYREIRSYLP